MASNRDLIGTYLMQKVSAAAAAEFQRLTREERGQRDGQAFMNCLHLFDREKYDVLTNTSWDPFYIDKNIRAAIDRLEQA